MERAKAIAKYLGSDILVDRMENLICKATANVVAIHRFVARAVQPSNRIKAESRGGGFTT